MRWEIFLGERRRLLYENRLKASFKESFLKAADDKPLFLAWQREDKSSVSTVSYFTSQLTSNHGTYSKYIPKAHLLFLEELGLTG